MTGAEFGERLYQAFSYRPEFSNAVLRLRRIA